MSDWVWCWSCWNVRDINDHHQCTAQECMCPAHKEADDVPDHLADEIADKQADDAAWADREDG